jgi:hypothetical protein
MEIPTSFKNHIKSTFYDKELTLYTVQDTIDDQGWQRISGSTVVDKTFKGNVRFDKLDKLQEAHGLKERIHMAVTTEENIPSNSIIGYLGRQTKVIRAIPYDSHYLLLAQEWSSQSSTSISA